MIVVISQVDKFLYTHPFYTKLDKRDLEKTVFDIRK